MKKLELLEFVRETLDEYMATYQLQQSSIERFDARIEELAADGEYAESVKKLGCFLGIKTHTALSVIVETSDFLVLSKEALTRPIWVSPPEKAPAVNISVEPVSLRRETVICDGF